MKEKRFTATKIAEILGDALEVQEVDRENMHHRVRYLAKKHYLFGGRIIDNRGTLDFPVSEVFRAAILCEFLAFSMDVKVASAALEEAAKLRLPPSSYPASARTDSGWSFSGGLGTVVRGVEFGEDWFLVVELRRSGRSGVAGLVGRYVRAKDQEPDVNEIFGRAAPATFFTVRLTNLFAEILERL